ncbi:MAG: hypothetical protein AABY18_04655 [Candidatus Thermoplasmatota archaeon]
MIALAAHGVAAEPLRGEDAAGDVARGSPAVHPDDTTEIDILAFQVGPENSTHVWVSLMLARVQTEWNPAVAHEHFVEMTLDKTGETLGARFALGMDGWVFNYRVSGGSRSVGLLTEGTVNGTTLAMAFPKSAMAGAGDGDTLSELRARTRLGYETYYKVR